jgi:enolase-phosphatase E1
MSRLRIFPDDNPNIVLFESTQVEAIRSQLAQIGVGFEQWPTRALADNASNEDILASYKAEVDRLIAENGFKAVDVVSINPDHPERESMRAKFLSEHRHKEDEVRYFVRGSGLFTLHINDKVYEILCQAQDLIRVPDGTKHWFDMGAAPYFTAIRFFTEADGWVGYFTDSDIALKFPRFENNVPTVRAIVTDIEGTTSSISFVRDVLFPHARAALPQFIKTEHSKPEVAIWLARIAEEKSLSVNDLDGIIAVLLTWIDADIKHTALKALQGMLWADGYTQDSYRAPIYADAFEQLSRWHENGIPLYVYSSGSVSAQKLFFTFSDHGDTSKLFSGYYDTEMGGKRDKASYQAIAKAIAQEPAHILFLSDIVEELNAAREAGWQTVLVDRLNDYPTPRIEQSNGHQRVTEFTDIVL